MKQIALAWLLLAGGISQAQDLHFKTRTLGRTEVAGESELKRALADKATVHKIVQYSHPPGTAEIEALLQNGVEVVAALPDNAIIVSAPGGQVDGADGAVWAGRIEPRDKLSPALPEG
ncbi:MAG TPA: hypothetical protein VNH18_18175, partial [Bryobacteraceae bacterium]|nr:hypothetical protein [Bryobacteraceae bacterium]